MNALSKIMKQGRNIVNIMIMIDVYHGIDKAMREVEYGRASEALIIDYRIICNARAETCTPRPVLELESEHHGGFKQTSEAQISESD